MQRNEEELSKYRIREKSDYSDFYVVSKADAARQIKRAEEFLTNIEEYLNK